MRKFLPYIFIFIVIFGFFTPTHFAFGQSPGMLCPDGTPATYDELGNKLCDSPKDQNGNSTGVTKVDAQNNPVGEDNSCGLTNIPACIMKGIANIAYLILSIIAFILWLSGILLEFVLKFTILEMKNNISGMTGIDIVWRTIRDLVNIAFIFILLKEGIQLIISQSDTTKAKNVVVGIVVTAILINFSVFFTKVIIDTSNIVTIGFYKSITNANGSQDTVDVASIKVPVGISGAYVNALKIGEFWKADNLTQLDPSNTANTDYKKLTIIGIMGSILFLILSFIFFAISMMLIIRFIVLVFLLVLSPIGFLGFGLPSLKSYQTKWWDTLIGQAMFAPLFMILTWINLTLISNGNFTGVSMNTNSTGLSYNDLFIGGNSTNVGLIFNFIVIIGFAVISLTVSKGYASKGATQIGEWTGKLTSFAGGALMGGTAALGRNTIGRTASRLARSESFQKAAGKNVFARAALTQTRKISDSTFDARKTSAVGKVTSSLGLDIGKATDKNFNKVMDEKSKEKIAFAKSLDRSKEGREAYARGLAGEGILSRLYVKGGSVGVGSKRSMFGMLGRDNRIAAASILGDRVKELTTEFNTLRSEMTQLLNAQGRRPLTAAEQDRLDQLQGGGIYAPGMVPGGPVGGLVRQAQDEITRLKAEISTQSLDETLKKQY